MKRDGRTRGSQATTRFMPPRPVVNSDLWRVRWIDRLSAIRIMPYLLTPLVLAMMTVGLVESAWGVIPYMLLLGIQSGLYFHGGLRAVGRTLRREATSVRSKVCPGPLMVLSSAIGPVLMGWLADLGVPLSTVCLYFAAYTAAAAVLVVLTLRTPEESASRCSTAI